MARLVEMSEGAGKDLEKAARQRRGGILVNGWMVVGSGGGAAVAQRKTNLMILPVKEGFLTLLPLGLVAQTWQWAI